MSTTSSRTRNPSEERQKRGPIRKRASKPKSRAGCAACKAKHVKCDEVRPSCLRCMASEIQCPGYQTTNRRNRLQISAGESNDNSPMEAQVGSPLELSLFDIGGQKNNRALEFFHVQAAPIFSGYFYGKFWKQAIFHFGINDPALRTAMITLSSIFENECIIAKADSGRELDRSFALESHNQAIRHLMAYLEDPETNVLVALMTCILFVCIDFVRHDVMAARKNIRGGLQLLDAIRKNPKLFPSSELELLEDVIVPTITWLNMGFSIFGTEVFSVSHLSTIPDNLKPARQPAVNMEQSISQFVEIAGIYITFSRTHIHTRYLPERPQECLVEQLRIIVDLDQWRLEYDALVASTNSSLANFPGGCSPIGVGLVHAAWYALRIWTEVSIMPSELLWDTYRSDFAHMLDLVANTISDRQRFPDAASKSFAFEMPIIPILHMVALKCRWPLLRRRAIDLLCTCPEREAMFQARYSRILCQHIMKIEEENLPKGPDGDPNENTVPLEKDRVWRMDVPPLASTRHGRAVNFMQKPEGVMGRWQIRTEYINVNNLEMIQWGWEKVVPEEQFEQQFDQMLPQGLQVA
ncbi:hypothetical protein BT63DRAFT_455026 [Microthyrium microscopicum]|uniref:Zn(2)-C6 fungal-type domain-containing protein n=1 Tax=Microthyrium microscopicum TaxID=703497 RepID=A0A6A6UAS0_9PEZI|nr:hypothetical protein BT63DRAFT_455026 [Microthyrium microscopicum]